MRLSIIIFVLLAVLALVCNAASPPLPSAVAQPPEEPEYNTATCNWDAVPTATGYEIYVRTNGGTVAFIEPAIGTQKTITNFQFIVGGTYEFWMTATNSAGRTVGGNIVAYKIPPAPQPPPLTTRIVTIGLKLKSSSFVQGPFTIYTNIDLFSFTNPSGNRFFGELELTVRETYK